ncbi:MAG TPA: hypothetical protein VGL97_05365 [Bryobacteraceae bacterium]|jgi:hypothetical protein
MQAQSTTYKAPRMPNGHPNLNGIWQAMNTANWNLQDHPASPGPIWELGAIAAEPTGKGVVVGNDIPYKPEAAEKQKENFKNRRTDDPEAKCFMPGIPRANYMPYPFQIVETGRDILFVYEFASSNRLVNMGKAMEAPSDTWMGTNNGRWEGDTLVIDVTGLNGLAWLDRNGDFFSDKGHVVERFTRTDPDHMSYEARIEDPSVFTKPWTINMTLYRKVEKDAELLEFKCTEFAEQLLYGKYTKGGGTK